MTNYRTAPPLLRQGLPRFALQRVPLGRGEQAQEKPAWARAGCARVRCLYMDVLSANPGACSRSHAGMDARRPRPRGCPSLWLLSLGQARESDWPPGMADEAHRDVSRVSRQRQTPNQHHPHPTLPLKGRAKERISAFAKKRETKDNKKNGRPKAVRFRNHRRRAQRAHSY